VEGRDAVETNTFALDKVECTILGSLIVLAGSRRCCWRSHIGDQRRFHAINRFAVGGLLSIGAENTNHDGLYSERGAVRQSIEAPCFLGLDHFDFG